MANNGAWNTATTVPANRATQAVSLSVAARAAALGVDIPDFYLPAVKQTLFWDAPTLAHTGIDIDYKMTAYDWDDRELIWSVASGPSGMTIDADGTLHWTPSVEGSELVTVECSFGGQQTLSKTFTCAVDNSRCVFVATDGSDTTGNGSVTAPFASFEEASKVVASATTARMIYHRAGIYAKNPMSFFTGSISSMNTLARKTWAENEPFFIRNYPGEYVQYHLLSGGGWRFYEGGTILYGMDVRGAGASASNLNGTEQGGVVISGKSVAKRMKVYEYDCAKSGNCTGYRHTAETLLDQCEAWDNYDRLDPGFHNNGNFLAYATGSESIGTYVIDCLSDGIGARFSATGFKLKHAGLNPPVYHKCVDTGTEESFTAICDKMTVRKCVFFTDISLALGHGRTDEITGGVNTTDNGFLVEDNVVFARDTATTFGIGSTFDAVLSANPPLFIGNDFINYNNSADGNTFSRGAYTSSSGSDVWDIGFSNNRVFTPSPSNSVRVKGVSSGLATLTDMGTNNEILTAAPNYTFSGAGRNFQILNGVISEIV